MCRELDILAKCYQVSGKDRDRTIFVEARRRQGLDEPQAVDFDYTNFCDRGWLPPYVLAEVDLVSTQLAAG